MAPGTTEAPGASATPESARGGEVSYVEYPDDVEAGWSERIAAVRNGDSTEIRVSAPVTSLQFNDLADGCDGLTTLVLDDSRLNDADLDLLPTLPELRWIKFTHAVGDDGMATLGQCRSLEIVNLPGAAFSDRGLVALASLDRLELLRFRAPEVTAAGLKELPRLKRLRFLHLIDVPVTADGLKSIAAIDTLESFYLDGDVPATDDDLHALLTARPDLHFHYGQQHLPGDPNADTHE